MLLQRKGGGRVAAMEVLKVNLRVRDLIKDENRTTEIYEVLKDSKSDGMQSFDDHLAELYEQDLIEYETGFMAATSAQSFKMAATQVHEKRKMAAANANS
jgi:twitching motility protein PilT